MTTIKFAKAVIFAVVFATLSTAAPTGSASPVSNSAPLPSSAALPSLSATASGAINTPFPASSILSPISAPRSTRPATSTASATASAPDASQTVPFASNDPNGVLWGPDDPDVPQAIRGSLGATVLGPQDVNMVKENPDLLAPPSTDAGSVYVSLIINICTPLTKVCLLQLQREMALQFEPQPSPNWWLGSSGK